MLYADTQSVDDSTVADAGKPCLISNSKFYYPLNLENPSTDAYLSGLPTYAIDGSMGIDRLVFAITLDPNSIMLTDFLGRVFGEGNKTRGAVQLPGFPSIWVTWPDTTSRQYMKIDFNPSNFSKLDGFELCPPPLLLYYVKQVIQLLLAIGDREARPKFMEEHPQGILEPWPENWPTEVMLFEVHYARDFRITNKKFNLEQLKDVKPMRARAVSAIRDEGQLETITHPHSKDAPVHKFYDKHRERQKVRKSKKRWSRTFDELPKGTFRYEIELPRAVLRKINHKTLDILTIERIIKTARSYWSKSNYFQPLVWEGQSLEAISMKYGHEEAAVVLMYAHAEKVGFDNYGSEKDRRRYLRRLREFGFKTSIPFFAQGAPYGHLDYESGGLVEE